MPKTPQHSLMNLWKFDEYLFHHLWLKKKMASQTDSYGAEMALMVLFRQTWLFFTFLQSLFYVGYTYNGATFRTRRARNNGSIMTPVSFLDHFCFFISSQVSTLLNHWTCSHLSTPGSFWIRQSLQSLQFCTTHLQKRSPTVWRRASAPAIELSRLGSISDSTINGRIGASQAGSCINECAVPQMKVKLGSPLLALASVP